jgi:hypothetical protein
MNRSLRSPSVVHVEHLLISVGDGGALTSLPIVVSDDAKLLASLHDGLGMDDFAPMEWWFSVRCDPVQPQVMGCFNRAAGHRLHESLRTSMGNQWRWLPPVRTRWFKTVSGHAGRVKIPVGRLWQAWDDGLPEPASVESLARLQGEWGRHERLGFCNDGMVTIDVSRIRGVDPVRRRDVFALAVERLLYVPDIWDRIGKYEGHFAIRVGGRLDQLRDENVPFNVKWKLKRRRAQRYAAVVPS